MLQYMLFDEKVETIKKRTCNKSLKKTGARRSHPEDLAAEALMWGPIVTPPRVSAGDQQARQKARAWLGAP
jgi:hypothetical protein